MGGEPMTTGTTYVLRVSQRWKWWDFWGRTYAQLPDL
jgi:hypothetical protein